MSAGYPVRRSSFAWLLFWIVPGCGPCAPRTPPEKGTPVVKPVVNPLVQPEVRSPSLTRSARAFSIVNEVEGNTQVMVSFGAGGGGVFAVELPNVPLRLEWIDDSQLVVGYPEELKPSKQEDRIQMRGDVVKVRYETFSGQAEQIAALEKAYGRAATAKRRKAVPRDLGAIVVGGRSLRGKMIQLPEGDFRYDYYDVDEPDASVKTLQAMGYQGGGPSWAGIVFGLVTLKNPDLLARLRFDDEAAGLAVWSEDREALLSVAEWVTEAKSDPDLLKKAIAIAVAEGEME
jgi:hypothetical protein